MNDQKFVFISDFDGTLTSKDFYQIIIDKYLGEEGRILYEGWKEKEYKDKDFLNMIYSSINRNEQEIMEDILGIDWDESATQVIQKIKEAGGDFVILSAGTDYYIERLLRAKGLTGIKVYSNPGVYKDRGIHLELDKESPFYSETYGIDKGKVVQSLKERYSYVYYAGDSAPDIPPCKLADTCFATGALKQMLTEEQVSFIPMESFKDIERELVDKGVIKG